MRVAVILCLVAVSAAQYDYSVNTQHQQVVQHQQIQQQHSHHQQHQHGAAQLSAPIQPVEEYNKEFFTYSAPEHEFNDVQSHDSLSSSVRKNLRVIFIKGPENNGLENAAIQLAKSSNDERTAIYVLSKQADIGELANKLNSVQTISHKPEVHFIKYRTSADADNAQRTIQSQYDSLPGASSSHSGGSAPVLDFASKQAAAPAAQAAPASFAAPSFAQPAPAAPAAAVEQAVPANSYVPPPQSSSYLPPNRRL
ncbi:uncharacterized protein [Eurosta solidaginis]|uniref:uncharacterized protein n=1 Tax=Eurosta solidaginis TaxID=178769 RepID=UPI0035309047